MAILEVDAGAFGQQLLHSVNLAHCRRGNQRRDTVFALSIDMGAFIQQLQNRREIPFFYGLEHLIIQAR